MKTKAVPNQSRVQQQVVAEEKGLRRRRLVQRIRELEEQVKAARGETRKNLRARLARLASENAFLKGALEQEKSITLLKTKAIEELREWLATAGIDPNTGRPQAVVISNGDQSPKETA